MGEDIKLTKDENVPDEGTLEKDKQELAAAEAGVPDSLMASGTEKKAAPVSSEPPQAEDKIFRMAFRCFADEALPLFDVPGTPVQIMPTELTHLEWAYKAADFAVRMDDDSVNHFQFQSKNGGKEDLRRFRVSESLLSYQYKAPVVTNVIFSGNIRRPMKELTEGINTYKIRAITMKGHDADKLLAKMRAKAGMGEPLTKGDLLELALTPLMDGKMPMKERILEAFRLTQGKTECSKEDVRNSDTMLYTFAARFLEGTELEEVREVFDMTKLGELLVEAAVKRTTENVTREVRTEAARNLLDVLDVETIAEKLGLTVDFVQKLKDEGNAAKAEAV